MSFKLNDLPFAKTDLEPYLSKTTLDFHYDKHHQTYLNNLNSLIKDSEWENLPLEIIIRETYQDPEQTAVFNNASQIWNHDFFWKSMVKNGGGKPDGDLQDQIDADFGGSEQFLVEFKNAALTQFGSGWVWLVIDGGKLKIVKTANADNPLAKGQIPMFTLDVWEHAYYLDYQNRRADFVEACFKIINWQFVEKNLSK